MMDCLPQIHIAAVHAQPGFETFTPGIGVLCRNAEDWLLGGGFVRNSERRLSTYAMGGWQPLRIGPVKVGAVLGTISGYKANSGSFQPMGGLMASYHHAHFLWIPPTKRSAGALAVSFTIPF